MTVTYTGNLANCSGFGCFWRLLFRWKGSVYKLIWKDLVVYSILYFAISALYRFALNEQGRTTFEKISVQTHYYTDMIPIAFVLGFYVSMVIQRWWAQFELFTWPDNLCYYVSSYIRGNDIEDRLIRRTIVRYSTIGCTVTHRLLSPEVSKAYPTYGAMVKAGILMPDEKDILEHWEADNDYPKYTIPLTWAGKLAARARKIGKIQDDHGLEVILLELSKLRTKCGDLLNYDWINIPLVYTQVVTIAVYSFFLMTLISRQFLDPEKGYPNNSIDFVVPIFTYLQFIFYMGWLKVAETLVQPFGDDDDDFDIKWFVDRYNTYCYVLVDDMHVNQPKLVGDAYWDEIFPNDDDLFNSFPDSDVNAVLPENKKQQQLTNGSMDTIRVNLTNPSLITKDHDNFCTLLTMKDAQYDNQAYQKND